MHDRANPQLAINDALSLARVGELACRGLDEMSDQESFSALFRAIHDHLETVPKAMEAARG